VLPWQESSYIIFSVTGLFIYSLRIPWVISAFGLIWGIKSLKEFDLFGRNQIDKYMNNREDKEMEFVSRGPCKIVRNPFYLFILIMIWSYPILSMDRLLFLDLWSVWILIGTILEERDLVNQIGEGYKEYQSYLLRLLQSITA
jgi:protein-S-isoprenylcysteine O-methyltransferase Ste14